MGNCVFVMLSTSIVVRFRNTRLRRIYFSKTFWYVDIREHRAYIVIMMRAINNGPVLNTLYGASVLRTRIIFNIIYVVLYYIYASCIRMRLSYEIVYNILWREITANTF